MKKQANIPYHRPAIGEEEIAAVTEVLRSGWLTTGAKTAQFEREFAAYVHAPHALAVNSCTAGLHLALAALGIGPGDEVITTPLTFCATVNCILHVGATPVLADVGADGNLDPAEAERCITQRTRAIMPVHFGGLPCDMDAIWRLAKTHNLFVIEDAAHATGTHYRGVPIGGGLPDRGCQSDAVAFSFYATKNLTTGEGGMVTTHNPRLMEKMRRLCLHGICKDAWNRYADTGSWYYEVESVGFKYNLSDVQSAIGIPQLHKQEMLLQARTDVAMYYNQKFAEISEIELPLDSPDDRHAWHLYPIRLRLSELNENRAEIIQKLRNKGIATSVHFIPVPLHPAYAATPTLRDAVCPTARSIYERSISLPIYPDLSKNELARITEGVRNVVTGASQRTRGRATRVA
jgi:dTDP-4-amino-4,6-dideoxygalactose transaminase